MKCNSKIFSLLPTIILFFIIPLRSFSQISDEQVIKKMADGIIEETTFKFKHKESGKIVNDLTKALSGVYLTNPYNEWRYWNGVLGIAMQQLSLLTKEQCYANYAYKNVSFAFDHAAIMKEMTLKGQLKGMEQFFKHELLDDCGAMGADLLDIYRNHPRSDFRAYIDKTADYIYKDEYRLSDGTLARTWPQNKTVWLDDLYMSVPFMARYAVLANDNKYFDFCIQQVALFTKHLYSPKDELFFHCYYDNVCENGPAFWGRANGWCLLAQSELLSLLPDNYPGKDSLIKNYTRQIIGLSKYQGKSGLWHQILNKSDSFLETSATAMFTYAVALGINKGWLNKMYADLALSGWEGIKTMITPDGKVKNISKGTGTNTSLKYYYDRPTPFNDIHGLGPVILAGIEIVKLKRLLE